MANVRIFLEKDFLENEVQVDCMPGRFAIATNILMCATLETGEKGMLLFNYEPQKWNQWYPYFSSVNATYEFHGKTYGDLVAEFEKNIMTREDVGNRIEKAKNAFLNQLGIAEGFVELTETTIEPEVWLKYSKTQNVWTFYYMEFLLVRSLSSFEYPFVNEDMISFLPLTDEVLGDVLSSGQYRGIDIVDNTIELLKNQKAMTEITNASIQIV